MWQAIRNAAGLVAPRGQFFIAIYNDGGAKCRRWRAVKRIYNGASEPMRALILLGSMFRLWGPRVVREGLRGSPLAWMHHHGSERGMSAWTDLVDWVGGYPYEYARSEEVSRFCRDLGFELQGLKDCGSGIGCNEFVFASRRES
ncbi:MAG: hypothetical protein HY293_22000 [Planctomycetes bacterium]|nr:hypothetical protein [Planctomycetota bacterium]